MPNNILITPGSASIQFSGSVANTIRLQVEPSGSVAFYGNSGSLFGISDSLSGSLMSVNDISGLPILEVFSDDRVVMGTFNRNTLVVTGSRVGIDKAIPNADLDISGSVFITGSLAVMGNVSASSFTGSFSGLITSASGLTGGAPGYIPIWTSNTAQSSSVIFQSSGNVGINITAPTARLHVSGTITANNAINIVNDGGAASYLGAISTLGYVGTGTAHDFQLRTGGTVKVLIQNSTGNVGIGTTSPSAILHVNNGDVWIGNESNVVQSIVLRRNAATVGSIGTYNGQLEFSGGTTLGSGHMVITSTGNVGIGTTSPSSLLHVSSSNNTTAVRVDIGPRAQYIFRANSTSLYTTDFNMTDTGLTFGHDSTIRDIQFKTSTTRMTITGGGSIGINTTSPTHLLHVAGSTRIGSTTIDLRLNRESSGVIADANYFIHSANTPVHSWVEGAFLTSERAGTVTATNSGYPYYEEYFPNGTSNSTKTFGFIAKTSGSTFSNVDFVPRITIRSTGNVGIGTTTPGELLHVQGNISASTFVGNANTATLVNGTSGQLITKDDRVIEPNSITAYRMQFGFTSWNNNNNNPYADYLHLRSYSDATGGNDNLIMFRKDAIGMRIYQHTFGTGSAYATFKDVAFTDGNVATATALQNTRTIWGQNFNGTANVTGNLTSVGNITGTGAVTLTATSGSLELSATSTNVITLSTNGAERIRLTSTGNLGIDTTSPSEKLHVVGNVRVGNNSTYTDLVFGTDTALSGYNQTNYITPVTTPGAGTAFTALRLKSAVSAGTNRMDLIVDGIVGIGTTAPDSLLHVNGSNGFIRLSNSTTGNSGLKISYLNSNTHGLHLSYTPSSALAYIDNTYPTASGQVYGDIYFRQNVGGTMTNRMTIKAMNGNIGINTSTPRTTLDIAGLTSIESAFEKTTVSATAATGTINYDIRTQSVLYYTTNASGNWTANVRGDGTNTLNSILAVGQSITFVFMVTNGSPAYYQTGFQVDGSAITPKWQGGTAPTSGNANSIDVYAFVVTKTAATPTYNVLASVTRYA
jgi:hypothetical protein